METPARPGDRMPAEGPPGAATRREAVRRARSYALVAASWDDAEEAERVAQYVAVRHGLQWDDPAVVATARRAVRDMVFWREGTPRWSRDHDPERDAVLVLGLGRGLGLARGGATDFEIVLDLAAWLRNCGRAAPTETEAARVVGEIRRRLAARR